MRTLILTLALCASLLRCPAPVVVNSYRFGVASAFNVSGLVAYYDAALGVTTSGGNITAVADQSGNGYNLAASGGNVTAGTAINGKPTFDFTAANAGILATSSNLPAGVSGTASRTWVCVSKQSINSAAAYAHGGTAIGTQFCQLVFGSNWYFYGIGVDNSSGVAYDSSAHVHFLTYDGSAVDWQMDGTAALGTFPATISINTGTGPLYLGAARNLNFYLTGSIAVLAVYDRVLSSAEIAAIRSESTSRFGTP